MSTSRRILITGASQGLGLSLARHYLDLGDQIFGCSRGPAAITHERYAHFALDVGEEHAVQAMFDAIRTSRGGLDVLINNAGIASMNPIALTTADTARRIVETNLLGTFLLTRGGIRLLRTSKTGRIVNLTTVAVPFRLEGEALYAASKSAVETFTRVTAREVAAFNITCNAVGPSPVRTRLTEKIPEEKINQLLARQAIGRWAEPSDVANVIDFFLRPESRMVTGQIVYLGGAG
ncbi:MAG: SDR family oxidoreductase [Spirochaetes bacterium]|nr:SDR family oxidoreductase [Spirochaetota bacterium]